MYKLAEYLPSFQNATWTLARQAGVTHAVSRVPPDDLHGPGWEFLPLLRMKTRFAAAGLTLWLLRCLDPRWWHLGHDSQSDPLRPVSQLCSTEATTVSASSRQRPAKALR